jgi:hypothetical protein
MKSGGEVSLGGRSAGEGAKTAEPATSSMLTSSKDDTSPSFEKPLSLHEQPKAVARESPQVKHV